MPFLSCYCSELPLTSPEPTSSLVWLLTEGGETEKVSRRAAEIKRQVSEKRLFAASTDALALKTGPFALNTLVIRWVREESPVTGVKKCYFEVLRTTMCDDAPLCRRHWQKLRRKRWRQWTRCSNVPKQRFQWQDHKNKWTCSCDLELQFKNNFQMFHLQWKEAGNTRTEQISFTGRLDYVKCT